MGWMIALGVHGTSGRVISLGEIAQEPSGGASDGAGDGHGVAAREGKGSVILDCLCKAIKVCNAKGGRTVPFSSIPVLGCIEYTNVERK